MSLLSGFAIATLEIFINEYLDIHMRVPQDK